jgi:hypothetical protein
MKRNAETGRKRGKAEMGKLKADFRTEGVPTSVGGLVHEGSYAD